MTHIFDYKLIICYDQIFTDFQSICILYKLNEQFGFEIIKLI